MSVDPSKATAFDSIPEFEAIATIPGEGGISVYRPECFVLNHEHQASALSLDALTSMLYHVVAASPHPDGSAADLDLTMVTVAALSHPGSPEENKARQALLRAVSEHLLLTTTTDGTPFGGLRHQEDLIIFPHQGASPAIPEPGVSNEPHQDLHANEGPSRKRTLGDRDQDDLDSIVGNLKAGSEIGSLSETSLSTDASLRTMVTPIKQVS
jgi:hypothetical protein